VTENSPPRPTRATLYRWEEVPDLVSADLRRQVITGDRVMITRAFRRRGCVVEGHRHENEQLTYVLEGTLQFWVGDRDEHQIVVSAGEVLHVPANVPHRALALEDTVELDVFSPPRAEWRR
jgi:quercetin dioxygenase-like cupin family protein